MVSGGEVTVSWEEVIVGREEVTLSGEEVTVSRSIKHVLLWKRTKVKWYSLSSQNHPRLWVFLIPFIRLEGKSCCNPAGGSHSVLAPVNNCFM